MVEYFFRYDEDLPMMELTEGMSTQFLFDGKAITEWRPYTNRPMPTGDYDIHPRIVLYEAEDTLDAMNGPDGKYPYAVNPTEDALYVNTRLLEVIPREAAGDGVVTSEVISGAGGEINCGTVCKQGFDGNSEVRLTATPESPYEFVQWDECPGVIDGAICTVIMDENKIVRPWFGYRIAEVEFADPDLEICVEAFTSNHGLIWVSQVVNLRIDENNSPCNPPDITHLGGLEHFINMESLSIGDNAPITNAEALQELDKLRKITLDRDSNLEFEEDISWLQDLVQLEELSLDVDHRVSGWEALATLTGLTILEFHSRGINDAIFSHFGPLVNLRVLSVPSATVSDISTLSGMVWMEELTLPIA
jgi:hypothetical protein